MRRQRCLLHTVAAASAWFAIALAVSGCRSQPKGPSLGLIPANGFMRAWSADLNPKDDQLDRLFVREGVVFAYTSNNRAYALSASGGEMQAIMQLAPRQSVVRPPVVLGDKWIFPTLSTFEVYDTKGRLVRSIELDRAMRGPATGFNNYIYVGLDYPGGSRLAKIDLTRPYGKTLWEVLTFGGISSAPAVMEDAVYAASDDGTVWAVNQDGKPIWGIDRNRFKTEGKIIADVKADESSVYVACMDTKLYCLDRATGRIRWTYFAGTALRDSPVVTATAVYQHVPGKGLVAIDKLAGKDFREPLWIAPAAKMFLSADDVNVYALSAQNSIVALDKADGTPKFKSARHDFELFAQNTKDSMIYVATKAGEVVGIKPILKPGTMGEIVLAYP